MDPPGGAAVKEDGRGNGRIPPERGLQSQTLTSASSPEEPESTERKLWPRARRPAQHPTARPLNLPSKLRERLRTAYRDRHAARVAHAVIVRLN
jgi:hypothetical protein